ncbi:MAG: tetratricopeptide repeat protein [Candidatus Wallbacteria bacterium]|nr:tetratricopeptide repeat protein [Candidatus Wallbacteria bacterium]
MEINFYLGICAYKEKDYDKAADYLRKSIQLDPLESKYYYYYLLVLKEKGNYTELESVKAQIEGKKLKGKFVSYLERMFGVGKQSEPGELYFDDSDNFYSMGLSLAKKGDYDQALKQFDQALAKNPENVDILINIGNVYFVKDDYKNALVDYYKARKLSQDNFYINFFISRTFNRLGMNDLAREFYKTAQTIDAKNPELAELEKDISAASYKKVKGIEEKLATLFAKNQLTAESKTFYEQALKGGSSQNSGNYYNLGNLAMMEGKDKDAIVYLNKAIELDPKHLEAYISLGKLYSGSDKEKAVATFQKALELDPNNLEVLENLANLCLKTKDYPKAKECYEKLKTLTSSAQKIEQIDNILKTIP